MSLIEIRWSRNRLPCAMSVELLSPDAPPVSCDVPLWHAALHEALTPGIKMPRFTKYLPVGTASTISLVITR